MLGDPLVFEEARGGAVQICTRTGFTRATIFTGAIRTLVTNKLHFLTTHFFFNPISVYKYRYSLCDKFIRLCRA